MEIKAGCCQSTTPLANRHVAVGSRSGGKREERTITGVDTKACSTSSVSSQLTENCITEITCQSSVNTNVCDGRLRAGCKNVT